MSRDRLNDKQARFAELLGQGVNATEAYLQAFPGQVSRQSAATKAYKLRRHPLIAPLDARQTGIAIAAVDAAVERYAITAERVADEMARLAFTRIDQVADWQWHGEGDARRQVLVVRDAAQIAPEALSAISEVRRDAGGMLTVRLYSKREALMDIARLKGWIADKPIDQRNLVVLKVER